MRLCDADKVLKDISKAEEAGANRISVDKLKDYFTTDVGLVEAIPITDLYRMISNVQLDCDDSGFSAEYRDGYGDGTRNAIIEMVQALCGDYDGDCDEFWEKFLKWDERRRENGADSCR